MTAKLTTIITPPAGNSCLPGMATIWWTALKELVPELAAVALASFLCGDQAGARLAVGAVRNASIVAQERWIRSGNA